MVNAIVLIKTRHGGISDVAKTVAEIDGVSEVYSVGGTVDIVAIIRVKENEEISELVTEKLVKVDGIENTETMIAFKAYSRHDLETVFSIGFDS